MRENGITMARLARWMFDQLPESERRSLYETADQLQHSDPKQWPKDRVARMPNTAADYVMLVPPDLHVFFTLREGNGIELLDIMRAETVRTLRGSGRTVGAEG